MKILYIEDTADKYVAVTRTLGNAGFKDVKREKNYWNLLIRLKKQLVIS